MLGRRRAGVREAAMADQADKDALRKIWNPESLGPYQGKWIAFRHSFAAGSLPNAPTLGALLSQFDADIKNSKSPIFAFVTFEVFV
jgi:hypothetical protein